MKILWKVFEAMNLPEWAPSCSGASANSECPSYKKRLVVETQTTTCSYCTSSHTSKVQHTYISSFREPTLLETAGQLLERNIIKHKIVGTIRSWPQPLGDCPWVQRCWSSSRMVLCTSNIFHHLLGYSDLYDANYFPNIYSTRIPKRRKSGKGKMNSSNIGNIVTKPLSHSVVSLCC